MLIFSIVRMESKFQIVDRESLFRLYEKLYNNFGFDLTYINAKYFYSKRKILYAFEKQQFFKRFNFKKTKIKINKNQFLTEERISLPGINSLTGEFRTSTYLASKNLELEHKLNQLIICFIVYRPKVEYHNDLFKLKDTYYTFEVCHRNELSIHDYDNINTLDLTLPYQKAGKISQKLFKNKINIPPLPFEEDILESDKKYFNWEDATGIGAISGRKSYRCIDIDGCNQERFILNFLDYLGLPTNYEWTVLTGSNNGYHIWIEAETLPEMLLLSGDSLDFYEKEGVIVFKPKEKYRNSFSFLEMRWQAHNVLPPSYSIYGNHYSFLFKKIPKSPPLKVDPKYLFHQIQKIAYNQELNYSDIIQRPRPFSLEQKEKVWKINLVFFDAETTGLPASFKQKHINDLPHIVQLSYMTYTLVFYTQERYHFVSRNKKDFILQPSNYEIPALSTIIHGISNQYALKVGYNRKKVFNSFIQQLEQTDCIIGHNLNYDLNILRKELEREKFKFKFDSIQKICTMKIGCFVKNNKEKDIGLNELHYSLMGYHFNKQHNASEDIDAIKRCFEKLLEKNKIKVEIDTNDKIILSSDLD